MHGEEASRWATVNRCQGTWMWRILTDGGVRLGVVGIAESRGPVCHEKRRDVMRKSRFNGHSREVLMTLGRFS